MASRGLASAQGRGAAASAAPWFSRMNRASTSCLARSGPTRRGAHAGPPRVADARPPLGHGGVTPEGKIYTLMRQEGRSTGCTPSSSSST